MTAGRLTIVGLGPGPDDWLTPAALHALGDATDLLGYGPYLDRVPPAPGERRFHRTDNREEIARARHGLELAERGAVVAIVSGGDPGVFAMAAAVFEAIEAGEPAWLDLDIRVEPGVTAMLAAAARVGAPLGHDFAAISLSDNLKPWDVVERRLRLAAEADFALALYNPVSRARPWQLDRAFDALRTILPGATPVVLARAVGRPDERIAVTSLTDVRGEMADMATVILVGSSRTRLVQRLGRQPFVYTPRGAGEAAAR